MSRRPQDSRGTNSARNILGRGLRRVGRALVEAARGQAGRPTPTGPPHVCFEGLAERDVAAGSTLLQAAARMGVDLDHYCGGMCSCGTCRVEIVEGAHNLSPPQGMEPAVLGSSRAQAGDRLACQAKVLGTVKVRVPSWL